MVPRTIVELCWLLGWSAALFILVCAASTIALRAKPAGRSRPVFLAVFSLCVVLVAALAQQAVRRHDLYVDLTRNKTFTADAAAVAVVDSLTQDVEIFYFGHEDDPSARRVMTILNGLAHRSPLLDVEIADPDKDPTLARRFGVKFYNVAVVQAAGQRVLAKTTNEVDIAIAIQKALREKVTALCFVTGHGEAEIHNEEFHTHVEGLGGASVDHHHGHAHIPVVQSTPHGVGRLRRSLEALGHETKTINLTTESGQLKSCDVVSVIQPKYAYTPSEIVALEAILNAGKSLLLFFDIGYDVTAWHAFFETYGIRVDNNVLIDDEQHYETDNEALAISSYPQHVITKEIAMTIFPGARSLQLDKTTEKTQAIVAGNASTESLRLGHVREPHRHENEENAQYSSPPVLMAVADSRTGPGRLLVAGDADFLTNSYFPYLSNSALALAIFHWASGEQDAVKTEPAIPVYETLLLSQAQMNVLFLVLVFGVPSLVLLIGAIVWWKRA